MANGQADGQVVFEVSAETSKIKTAISNITQFFKTEGAQWDADTKTSTDAVTKNFDSMSKNATSKITDLTKSMINLATKGINKMMDYSDAVDKGSRSIGISAKAYQELDYAMNMSGANIDTLTRGVGNLNSALAGTASNEVKNALSGLGFTDEELASMSGMEELLDGVLYRLAGVQDTAERANIANSLFGVGAGSQLAAFFDEGAEGIKNLRQQAVDLGIVQSDEAIAQAVKTQDSIDTLNKTLDAVLMQAITPLLPLIQSLAELITPLIPIVTDIMNVLMDLLDPIFKLAGIDRESRERNASIAAGKKDDAEKAASGTDLLNTLMGFYAEEVSQATKQIMEKNGLTKEYAQYAQATAYLINQYGLSKEIAKEYAKGAYEVKYGQTLNGNNIAYDAKGFNQQEQFNNLAAKLGNLTSSTNATSTSMSNVAAAANHAASAMNSVNAPGGSGAVVSGAIAAVFGTHANGLDYVPYDGYFAMLHQGERVQTAAEADLSRRYGNQAPSADIGGAIRAGMGNMQIIWRGRVVADVLSEQQGDSFRALERSGWKS